MTLVDTLTGEVIETPSYGEVRQSVDSAKASLEAAAEQIVWQIEHRVWAVLGYADWNEMREAEYGGAAFMVPRAERPELLARMRRSGLTQQEIADTAGITDRQVRRDLASTGHLSGSDFEMPTITNARGQQRPASYTPRTTPAPALPTAAEAVAEFPDLAYYVEAGRTQDAVWTAVDLRRYRERGELDQRLDTLRRSIAVDRAKRDGTYVPGATAVMDDSGSYRMAPIQPASITTTRTCPACDGRGLIEE